MERRIREFEHSERDRYTRLQAQVHSHKSILVSHLMAAVSESVSAISDVQPASGSPRSTEVTTSTSSSRSTDIPGGGARANRFADVAQSPESPSSQQICFVAKDSRSNSLTTDDLPEVADLDDDFVPRLPVARSDSSSRRLKSNTSPTVTVPTSTDFRREGSVEIDDVFPYDPGFQEDPNLPFSDSDEDNLDTDEGSLAEDSGTRMSSRDALSDRRSSDGNNGPLGYSTSVPIDVPLWMRQQSMRTSQDHPEYFEEDEDDDGGGNAPLDDKTMAASIQALARSVHAPSSSEIFGELPKPPTRAPRVISSQHSRTSQS